ncbi:MAG: leucine-rich repeat domain-containing protein [Planctomycetota bacterium]
MPYVPILATGGEPDRTYTALSGGANNLFGDEFRMSSAGIAHLTNLTGLSVNDSYGGNNPVKVLPSLANQTKLESVRLIGSPITDLSPFAGLPNLKKLQVSYSIHIKDLSPLVGATKLEELSLSKPRRLESSSPLDLSPLTHLTNLKKLTLAGRTMDDLLPLQDLKKLEELVLTGNIADLTPLKKMNSLKRLHLGTATDHEREQLEAALPGCYVSVARSQ